MRLIDADALKSELAPQDDWTWANGAYVRDMIDAMPTVCGWISVRDRLPGEEDYRQCHENWDGAVIWTNGSDIGLGWYYTSTGNWADIYDCNIDDVTHWMPLPEPPKEVVKHAEQ